MKATSRQMVLDEKFDVYVSRPIANRLAAGFHRVGLSADHVSMIALVLGVSAGFAIASGGLWSLIGGALLIGMVIIDCADGAVARLNPPSDKPWRGRMFDGFADLGTIVAVHIGALVALMNTPITLGAYTLTPVELTAIAVAAFASFSWKSSVLDDIKQRLKPNSVDHDLERYRDQEKTLFERFLFAALCSYAQSCARLTGQQRPGGYELFRQVALVGPSHHLVAIAVAAMLAPLAPTVLLTYFLLTIGPGNLYLWFCLSRARRQEAEDVAAH